ncbi:MAG: potassium transporter TrkG [Thermonemataceae bacterium]
MNNQFFDQVANAYKKFQISQSPQMNIVWGFFLYTAIGFILLCLLIFHQTLVAILDSLFIATSAVSTTGLVTISVVDSYNIFGQIIVMLLFQLGGIGYMTLTTYFLLFTKKRVSRWHDSIINAEFTMPKSIRTHDFIKSVIGFTLLMEALGTIAFSVAFFLEGMSPLKAIWYGLFLSISAFCTAGFALFDNGFVGYQDNVFINLIISTLAIAGSLGFIVITDLWYRATGKSDKVCFTTKIVMVGLNILLTDGTMLIYFTEGRNIGETYGFLMS